jgi:CubicO group peptidase (beta-lactamase class C family)
MSIGVGETWAYFSYSNSGYVVLALIAERTTGRAFHDLVSERVCAPAGMADTAFLRSDELPSTPQATPHHAPNPLTSVSPLRTRQPSPSAVSITRIRDSASRCS